MNGTKFMRTHNPFMVPAKKIMSTDEVELFTMHLNYNVLPEGENIFFHGREYRCQGTLKCEMCRRILAARRMGLFSHCWRTVLNFQQHVTFQVCDRCWEFFIFMVIIRG